MLDEEAETAQIGEQWIVLHCAILHMAASNTVETDSSHGFAGRGSGSMLSFCPASQASERPVSSGSRSFSGEYGRHCLDYGVEVA